MSCAHLVPAQKLQAFYSKAQGTLTISAEVTIGPGNYGAHICRSILDAPVAPTPSFVVSAPAPHGVQPDYVVVRTLSESFPYAQPPATVVVYSAGVDAPVRTEVRVSDTPAPSKASAATSPVDRAATPAAAPAAAPRTVIGWSRDYDYDAALADAISQLRQVVGTLNPDVGVNATVIDMGVALGGFRANTGLYIKLQTA